MGLQMWKNKYGLQMSDIWGFQLNTSAILMFGIYTHVDNFKR